MNFKIKPTQNKEPAGYKSLYIKESLIKKIEKIAKDNNTSFNNVVISMVEHCLKNFKLKNVEYSDILKLR